LNGVPALSNFDIFATGGALYKAVVQQFTATADGSGQIVAVFTGVNGIAQGSGIEVLSGGTQVLAIKCGLGANSGVTVRPTTFTNQGTLLVASGDSLNVSGLKSNVGNATLSGAGSVLTLSGTNYVVNAGLAVGSGQTLTLNGTWTNAAG